jgi:hypothetical protein
MAGRVHVDFWVFGFDVDFGNLDDSSTAALTLEEFYQQVLQADLPRALSAPSPTKAITSATPPGGSAFEAPPVAAAAALPHVFSCNNGLIPSGSDASSPSSADLPWNVRGAVFQFTIGCKFAIDSATIITGQLDPSQPPIPPLNVSGNGKPIYAKPMQLVSPLSSSLTVTITPVKPKISELKSEDDGPKTPRWDVATAVIKSVPTALWGICESLTNPSLFRHPTNPLAYNPDDPTADPASPSNPNPNYNPNLLSGADPAVPLPMGLLISSPNPVLSSDIIPPFPFKTFFTGDVSPEPYPFPAIPPADPAWFPEPEDPKEDEWEKVRGLWNGTPGLGKGAAEMAVQLWAGLSFSQWDLTPVGSVSGKAPGALLTDGVFQTLFLEAPRVGVAMA